MTLRRIDQLGRATPIFTRSDTGPYQIGAGVRYRSSERCLSTSSGIEPRQPPRVALGPASLLAGGPITRQRQGGYVIVLTRSRRLTFGGAMLDRPIADGLVIETVFRT